MATAPTNISYGTITGQYLAAIQDGLDPDFYPDAVPCEGTITFYANIVYATDATASPNPVTIVPKAITAYLDSDGYIGLNTVNGFQRGISLIATDDPDLNPTGFTYTVSPNLSVNGERVAFPTFSITVPSNSTQDLTTITPVPASPGTPIIAPGPVGPAPNLNIGTVTTGAAGSSANASFTGSSPNYSLNLTIPRGDAANKQQVIDSFTDAGAKLRTNLFTNPNAESTQTTGWTANKTTLSSDTAWSLSGTRSFRMTASTAADCDFRAGNATTIPFNLVPGKTYTVSGYVRTTAVQTSPDVRARRVIVLTSTDGASLVWNYGNQAQNRAGVTRSSLTFTVPPTATGVIVMFGAGATNTDVWWDNLLLEEGSTLAPYFDGNQNNGFWTGAQNLSTSTTFQNVARAAVETLISSGQHRARNLIVNSNFLNNASFYNPIYGAVAKGSPATTPAWATDGNYGVFTSSGANAAPRLEVDQTGDILVTPGEYVGYSAILQNDAGYTSRIALDFRDINDLSVSTVNTPAADNQGVRVTMSTLVPANAVIARPRLEINNAGQTVPNGVKVLFGKLIACKGSSSASTLSQMDYGYFDGNSQNAYFDGIPNASTSTGTFTRTRKSTLPGTVAPVLYFDAGTDRVVLGDTGVRNITSLVPTYSTGTIQLQRVNETVIVQASDLVTTSANGTLDLNILPVGFRPAVTNVPSGTIPGISTAQRRIGAMAAGIVRVYSYTTADSLNFYVTFPTSDAWPTTLPGV